MMKPHFFLLTTILLLVSCKGIHSSMAPQVGARTMLLLNGESVGCGFFTAYKDNEDGTKTVMVSGRMEEMGISKAPKTFEIGHIPGLEVRLDDYGQTRHGELCAASVPHGHIIQQIKATTGRVTIFISKDKIEGNPYPRAFGITVILKDVTFPLSSGSSYYIENAEMKDVIVGRQPG